jgi:hypothetical protein
VSTNDDGVTVTQTAPGSWVLKAAAAAQMGVSERTIDRRIAAGKLQSRHGPSGAVEVFVSHSSPIIELVSELRALAEENARLKARIAELEQLYDDDEDDDNPESMVLPRRRQRGEGTYSQGLVEPSLPDRSKGTRRFRTSTGLVQPSS